MTCWHTGRTFYACERCSAQEERGREDQPHPERLDCWNCFARDSMKQWTPPAVARIRAAG